MEPDSTPGEGLLSQCQAHKALWRQRVSYSVESGRRRASLGATMVSCFKGSDDEAVAWSTLTAT